LLCQAVTYEQYSSFIIYAFHRTCLRWSGGGDNSAKKRIIQGRNKTCITNFNLNIGYVGCLIWLACGQRERNSLMNLWCDLYQNNVSKGCGKYVYIYIYIVLNHNISVYFIYVILYTKHFKDFCIRIFYSIFVYFNNNPQ